MHRSLLLLATVAALSGRAEAEPCPLAVTLDGERALVAAVGEVLARRGIALDPVSCPAMHVRIERRDGRLAIQIDHADGTSVERIVGEPETAATVIESFARVDVGAPLLAARPVERADARATRGLSGLPPATSPSLPPMSKPSRGVQLFTAFETSLASDRTSWLGMHLGVCVTLGSVCGAARLRAAVVVTGPGVWKDQVERRGTELLIGIDVPFELGGMTLAPGFAAGLGQMHTRGATSEMRAETGGVRADVHSTLSIPMTRRLELDLFAAVDLTQETRVEWGPTEAPLPDEPRALLRLGVGMRYGGL